MPAGEDHVGEIEQFGFAPFRGRRRGIAPLVTAGLPPRPRRYT